MKGMKTLSLALFICLLSGNFAVALAKTLPSCSKLGAQLWGESVFHIKGEVKRERDPMPAHWNANSDIFQGLFLKTTSASSPIVKKATTARIGVEDSKGERREKTYQLEGENGGWNRLKTSNFEKDILPGFESFPAKMKMALVDGAGQALCQESFEFGVIK